MNKEELLEFLTPSQQKSLEFYNYLLSIKMPKNPIKKGDYIKFMYKYNYQFMEGGIVIETDEWPIVRLKSYSNVPNSFYKIDLSKVYVFYKKSNKMTKRDYFEQLLENLEKGQLKKSK